MKNYSFLLDEDVSHRTLKRLRKLDFRVESVSTLKIKGKKNGPLIEFCKRYDYVLITHDKGFLNQKIANFPGIIVVRIHPVADIVTGPFLLQFLEDQDASIIPNAIIELEKRGWKFANK